MGNPQRCCIARFAPALPFHGARGVAQNLCRIKERRRFLRCALLPRVASGRFAAEGDRHSTDHATDQADRHPPPALVGRDGQHLRRLARCRGDARRRPRPPLRGFRGEADYPGSALSGFAPAWPRLELVPYGSTLTVSSVTRPLPIMPSRTGRNASIFSSLSTISMTIGRSSESRRILAV